MHRASHYRLKSGKGSQAPHRIFLILGFISCLFPPSALGTVTVSSYENASEVDTGNNPAIVYGGTAGDATGCPATGALCDNCDDAAGTLAACNKSRVVPSTVFRAYFESDSKSGNAMIGDDTTGASVTGYTGTNSVSAGNTASVTITWANICNKIASGYNASPASDCETIDTGAATTMNHAAVLRLGIDANSDGKLDSSDDYARVSFKVQRSLGDEVSTATGAQADATNGIYDFSIYPGDEKVYLENIAAWDGFPLSANSTRYTKVHLLYLPFANCAAAANAFSNVLIGQSGKSTTQNIESDGNLSDERFYGLTNETNYVFKVALEDQAGNVGLFTPDSACVDSKHSKAPGEVFGLLKEEQNCFIATAAFGSRMSKQVQTFRNFRDQVLLKFKLGREFVRSYYNWSPQAAKSLQKHEALRTAARWALYPVWGLASLTLWLGGVPTLALGLALIALGILGHRLLSERRRGSE